MCLLYNMENVREEGTKQKQKQIALLNQGAYGCIIRPSIKCSGQVGPTQYITKIQKKKNTADRETQLGALIRAIPSYSNFFAPVVDTCDVALGVLQHDELRECEFLSKTGTLQTTYTTNKIKYVGQQSIADYLLAVLHSKPKRFFFELVRTFVYGLRGISKLNQKGIYHLDLKDNNIMVREKDHVPIIIDFGLSITDDLIQTSPKEAFFTYGPDYGPWCFDVCLATYVADLKQGDPKVDLKVYPKQGDLKQVSQSTLLEILNQFFIENPAMNELLEKDERDDYKKRLTAYITPFIGKPPADIYTTLCATKTTWDTYALAVIYLELLKNLDIGGLHPKMTQFRDFLKAIVLADPEKRMDAPTTKGVFEKTFTTIPRGENKRLVDDLRHDAMDTEKMEQQRTRFAASKLSMLKKEVVKDKA